VFGTAGRAGNEGKDEERDVGASSAGRVLGGSNDSRDEGVDPLDDEDGHVDESADDQDDDDDVRSYGYDEQGDAGSGEASDSSNGDGSSSEEGDDDHDERGFMSTSVAQTLAASSAQNTTTPAQPSTGKKFTPRRCVESKS